MHFKKLISIWALLALMLGQVTLAQHSASHIEHGFDQEIIASHDSNDEQQNDKDNQKHQCPECLLTKSLQTAFYHSPVMFSVALPAENLISAQQSYTAEGNRYKANAPRAPPSILI